MARWRLLNPHYLNVPGTEWEYSEVSRTTGKQARVRYPVPLLLNPDDPNDCNYPGEIIVAHDKKHDNRDIVFIGLPTADMEPIDEEARRISDELRPRWAHPINDLPSYGDYSQSLMTKFEGELSAAIKRAGGVSKGEIDNVTIKVADFEALKRQVAELAKQNAVLLAKAK